MAAIDSLKTTDHVVMADESVRTAFSLEGFLPPSRWSPGDTIGTAGRKANGHNVDAQAEQLEKMPDGSLRVPDSVPKQLGDRIVVPSQPTMAAGLVTESINRDYSSRLTAHWFDTKSKETSSMPLTEFQKKYPDAVFFRGSDH